MFRLLKKMVLRKPTYKTWWLDFQGIYNPESSYQCPNVSDVLAKFRQLAPGRNFAISFVSSAKFRCEISRSWNAKCPIFFGNFTPKTSNYCLKNRALGFPGVEKKK